MLDIEVRITVQDSDVQTDGDGVRRTLIDTVAGNAYATKDDLVPLVEEALRRAKAAVHA